MNDGLVALVVCLTRAFLLVPCWEVLRMKDVGLTQTQGRLNMLTGH